MTIDGGVLEVEKKANHQANVVRVKTIYPHPDPETTELELIEVDGYQVVVRKGEFQIGDLAIYVQPDSIVPQTEPFKFIWEQHVGLDGTVPEKRRRITVRKFRKEWSEGLLLPTSDFPYHTEFLNSLEGTDVSEFLDITHYDPDKDSPGTKAADVFQATNLYGTIDAFAPLLYCGPFDKEKIMKLADGPSFVKGAGHIREGCVIVSAKEKHVRGLGRLQVKIVSNEFLSKDGKV